MWGAWLGAGRYLPSCFSSQSLLCWVLSFAEASQELNGWENVRDLSIRLAGDEGLEMQGRGTQN